MVAQSGNRMNKHDAYQALVSTAKYGQRIDINLDVLQSIA